MQVQHRPSILHRPVREAGKVNVESADIQYEREQALLRAKGQRQSEAHDRLMRSLYPTPSDKAAVYQEIVRSNELLAPGPAQAHRPPTAQAVGPSRSFAQDELPWHTHTATMNYSPEEEEAARRRFATEVAAENYRLMQEKKATGARHAVEEQEAARRTVLQDDSWFNRGAVSPRWIAPEHRSQAPRPATATTTAGAVVRAPWATLDDLAAAQAKPQRATAAAPPQYPWSWQ